jgi:hypothetical protein
MSGPRIDPSQDVSEQSIVRMRFSLKVMLLLTTIAALACYEAVLPTLHAQRFVQAVAEEDYHRADKCFRNPADGFLFDYYDNHWRFKADASPVPWTFRQFFRGERWVSLRVLWGDAGPIRGASWIVVATRDGLLTPSRDWRTGGGFGGGGIACFPSDASDCST